MSFLLNPFAFGSSAPDPGADIDWTDPNPLTAHRYWRLHITANGGGTGPNNTCIAELYLRDPDGNLLSGTWTANDSGAGAVANLTDGNPGTFWGTSIIAYPHWVMFDMGVGNADIVDQIEMTPRTTFQGQAPRDFVLQYSDNAVDWTDATEFEFCPWESGTEKTFRSRPYIIRFLFDDPPAAHGFTTCAELEIRAVAGGPDLTSAATVDRERIFGQTDGSTAIWFAFDDDTSNYFGNVGASNYAEYRFDAEPTISTVAIWARVGFQSQAPESFKILNSRDGSTFHEVYQSPTQAAWASGEEREFVL